MNTHTFAVCAYRDSPYLETCIRSLKRQTVPTDIIVCTSTPSPYVEEMAGKYGLPYFVREGESDIQADWNFACEMAASRLVTIAHQDDYYHRDYAKHVQECWEKYADATVFCTDCAIIKNGRAQKPGMFLLIKKLLRAPLRLHKLAHWRVVKRAALMCGIRLSVLPVLTTRRLWEFRFLILPANLHWTGIRCGGWRDCRGGLSVWRSR